MSCGVIYIFECRRNQHDNPFVLDDYNIAPGI